MLRLDPLSERQAQQLRRDIVTLAAERNLDSAAVAAALADTLAVVAVNLDRQQGTRNLDERIDSFAARCRDTYLRTHAIAEKT